MDFIPIEPLESIPLGDTIKDLFLNKKRGSIEYLKEYSPFIYMWSGFITSITDLTSLYPALEE
jgi:hypothetical protein